MIKNCTNCETQFEISESDHNFYTKMRVSTPTLCPHCRAQRKMLQINHLNLFKRKCSATNKEIVTNFPPEAPYKVFDLKYYYSDKWDETEYGEEFNFNKPFFEQYKELSLKVPYPALTTTVDKNENADYTNYAGYNRNCYLIFDSDENENCSYSFGINSCKKVYDSYRLDNCELAYENIDSKDCYNCSYTINSENCSDSIFLKNCIGVKNSIMCSNLKNKEHHVFNKPVSKEEFQKIKDSLQNYSTLEEAKKRFQKFKVQFPQKYRHGTQNENVSGDYLVNCKNTHESFDCRQVQDGKYLTGVFMESKDCMDCDETGLCELAYESIVTGFNAYNIRFTMNSIEQINNITYCNFVKRSSNLFGCISLKRKEYCILNKQYTQEEYEKLIPKIIKHMKSTNEWGEFFPPETSCFPYNLTKALKHYPLTKEEALQKGYTWQDDSSSGRDRETINKRSALPDNIDQTSSENIKEILTCNSCTKPFKIIEQELSFHKQTGIPLPRNCFLCRHKSRYTQRNKRILHDQECQKCQTPIQTTYAPNQPEIVYCEPCYLESLN